MKIIRQTGWAVTSDSNRQLGNIEYIGRIYVFVSEPETVFLTTKELEQISAKLEELNASVK